MSIGDRLKEAREGVKLTQSALAEKVKKSIRTVSGWESGSTSPNAEDLIVFDKLGMDVNYIITGKKLRNEKNYIKDNEYIYVPVYDVEVSAGFGAEPKESECIKRLAFRRRWAEFHNFKPECLIVVKATGDSMYPLIHNNDYLVVNREKNMPVNGKIFVVRVRNELKVKYIETKVNGDLHLRSVNDFYKDDKLTPAELVSEDVEIIGEVVHVSHDM